MAIRNVCGAASQTLGVGFLEALMPLYARVQHFGTAAASPAQLCLDEDDIQQVGLGFRV